MRLDALLEMFCLSFDVALMIWLEANLWQVDTSRILPQLEHAVSELFNISEPQLQDLSTDTVGALISVFSLCECGVFSLTFNGN